MAGQRLIYSADAVPAPDILILRPANLLNSELRARILGNENSANVLADRTDTDQLNSAHEQDSNDHRRPSFRLFCPYQCLENEISSKHKCEQRNDSTEERCHSQRNNRKSGSKFEPDR